MKKQSVEFTNATPELKLLLQGYANGKKLTASEYGKVGAWARKNGAVSRPQKNLLLKLLQGEGVRITKAVVEFEFKS